VERPVCRLARVGGRVKRNTRILSVVLAVLFMLLFAIGACGPGSTPVMEREYELPSFSPASLDAGEKLKVVATTSIVHDVVSNIGRDLIELTMLMPLGADPHSFEPTPKDIAAVSNAHLLFANGAGLEEFLDPLLESAGAVERVVHVSHNVKLIESVQEMDEKGADPHTWTNPNNVIVWAHTIEHALSALDPGNAEGYKANTAAYVAELNELDAWIRNQVSQVPRENRQIVTDHLLFAYLAQEYGFTQAGAIVPGFSTMAQPAARELAALEDLIRELGVRAVFVGHTVNPSLAETVAKDTGAQLVFIYTGSLAEKGGDNEADTYLGYIRYNIKVMVSALK